VHFGREIRQKDMQDKAARTGRAAQFMPVFWIAARREESVLPCLK
jgi:hypothetical protein